MTSRARGRIPQLIFASCLSSALLAATGASTAAATTQSGMDASVQLSPLDDSDRIDEIWESGGSDTTSSIDAEQSNGGGGMSGNADGAGYSTSGIAASVESPESAPMTGNSGGAPYSPQGTSKATSSDAPSDAFDWRTGQALPPDIGDADPYSDERVAAAAAREAQRNIGPKWIDPAASSSSPDTSWSSTAHQSDRREAGETFGQAIGELIGSAGGESGKWAGGTIGKEIGGGVGELYDKVAGEGMVPAEDLPSTDVSDAGAPTASAAGTNGSDSSAGGGMSAAGTDGTGGVSVADTDGTGGMSTNSSDSSTGGGMSTASTDGTGGTSAHGGGGSDDVIDGQSD